MSAASDVVGGGNSVEIENSDREILRTAVLDNMSDSSPSGNKTSDENFETESSEITENSSVPSDINNSPVVNEEVPCSDLKEISDASDEQQKKLHQVTENSEDDEWLDILGSGDFKKKVVKAGSGEDSGPKWKDWVTANIICYNSNGDLIESHENLKFRLGDLDVIQGLEMAVALMQLGEKAEILVPARLAYGKFGRSPDIPPESDLKYEAEVLTVQDDDDSQLSFNERLQYGHKKRDQGNFWYGAGNYVNAIHCYQRAAEYLDGIDGSDNPPQKLQDILDTRIKVNNNLAAAHLKMEAHDAALRSLDFVLKMQPNNVKAHFRKGKILATKGLTANALVEMKIAARLEPDSKIIQLELQKLQKKQLNEDNAQKAMYQRMFASNSTSKPKSEAKSWFYSHWSLLAGGMAAVAAGVAAYRQFHYTA